MAFKGLEGMNIPKTTNRMTKPEKTDTIQVRHSVKKQLDRYTYEEDRKTVDVASEILSIYLTKYFDKKDKAAAKKQQKDLW